MVLHLRNLQKIGLKNLFILELQQIKLVIHKNGGMHYL